MEVVVSIGSSSPRELVGVILVTCVGIALVSAPVLLSTGELSPVVDGVAESAAFTGVDSEVDNPLVGQPRVTVHLAANVSVRQVTSGTITGQTLDSTRVNATQTTASVRCKSDRTCVIRAFEADGSEVGKITVTVERTGLFAVARLSLTWLTQLHGRNS